MTQDIIARRANWIAEIRKLSGNFTEDVNQLEKKLADEIAQSDTQVLIDHLRFCGNMPESYRHDSSEEKLYSKYTDCLLAESFKKIGLRSIVLKERADVADVEVFAPSYSFVADAKSFRLSRTAKNQKDFKIEAMDNWKRGKQYAMVVCPIYQLPNKSSQIYQQATARNVCIFTYSHLAILVKFSLNIKGTETINLLQEIFKTISAMNPSKDASNYWLTINRTMLNYSPTIEELWMKEKQATIASLNLAKQESLTFLAQERERIMRMTHEEAVQEILKLYKIESRIKTINSMTDNQILANK